MSSKSIASRGSREGKILSYMTDLSNMTAKYDKYQVL